MTASIRPARTGDVPAIFRVRTSVKENLLSLAQMTSVGITEASIAAKIEHERCAWVAVIADEIVGFSMIDLELGALFALFVLPSHEGRGVGRLLIQAAEEALFDRHEIAWLETGRSTRAHGFYRRLGWGDEEDIGGGSLRLSKRRV